MPLKASLYDWYRTTVLQRLLPTSKRSLSSQRFWDHMSSIDGDHIQAIEQQLARQVIDHYHVDLKMLIFDATNFDTFIDSRTLTEALISRWKQLAQECEEITLVFDGGNTSRENIEALQASPYHFITSVTLTNHVDLLSVPLGKFSSFADPRLVGTKTYRTQKEIWGTRRTVVITRSRRLLEGQIAGINHALRKKRATLRELRAKLARSQKPGARGKGYSRESLQKHLDSITSGQYVSQILKAEISESEGILDFRFWTDWAAYEQLKRSRLGKRILCTDNQAWSSEKIILAGRAQHHVERAFKQMKNPHWVSFSPAFHWTDQKLRVHAFYCVLALLLSSVLQRKAAHSGLKLTIEKLLAELSGVTELVNLFAAPEKGTKGRYRAEYVLSERSPLQDKLCRILDVYKYAHR